MVPSWKIVTRLIHFIETGWWPPERWEMVWFYFSLGFFRCSPWEKILNANCGWREHWEGRGQWCRVVKMDSKGALTTKHHQRWLVLIPLLGIRLLIHSSGICHRTKKFIGWELFLGSMNSLAVLIWHTVRKSRFQCQEKEPQPKKSRSWDLDIRLMSTELHRWVTWAGHQQCLC